MSVAWILREKGRKVFSALPNTSLNEIVDVLARHKVGAIVVADEMHRVLGIVSERDIVRILADDGAAVLSEPVGNHMTKPVMSCGEHHSIDWVMSQMTQNRFRHMPVTDDGRLVGIISIGDVVKYKIAVAEAEAEQMKQYFVAG